MLGLRGPLRGIQAALEALHTSLLSRSSESSEINARLDRIEAEVLRHQAEWAEQMATADAALRKAESTYKAVRSAEERTRALARAAAYADPDGEDEQDTAGVFAADASGSYGQGMHSVPTDVGAPEQFTLDAESAGRLAKAALMRR